MGRLDDVVELSLKIQDLRDRLRDAEEELERLIASRAAAPEKREPPVAADPVASAEGAKHDVRQYTARLENLIRSNPTLTFTPAYAARLINAPVASTRTILRRLVITGWKSLVPNEKRNIVI